MDIDYYVCQVLRVMLNLVLTLSPAAPGVMLLYYAQHLCNPERRVFLVIGILLLAGAGVLIVLVGWPTFELGNPYNVFG